MSALAKLDAHSKSLTREARAKRLLEVFTALDAKLADYEDDIRALWQEFESLGPDETIMGCRTKKEFCETCLHRTPRAVRYMLDGGNPVSKRGETVSLPDPSEKKQSALTILYEKLSALFTESANCPTNLLPEVVRQLTNGPMSPEDEKTLRAVVNYLGLLSQVATKYGSELREFLKEEVAA